MIRVSDECFMGVDIVRKWISRHCMHVSSG